ncbi:MAG TPA: hypothetical protein VL961_03185, partial [Acidimicrobiales bacterium]|nr:hypothetical protein [Acidimicrobiales bacterium]
MPKSRPARFVALATLLARAHPHLAPGAIEDGLVLVDGRPITNPAALVRADCALRVRAPTPLR